MVRWLIQDLSLEASKNCIYQYDEALEFFVSATEKDKGMDEKLNDPDNLIQYQEALYCLNNFDTEKEGDTIRTQFIHKIRKILDERDFIPEFKQIWLDVKAGKIEVKDPWKR